jgi:hypothetical protein
MTIPFDDSHLHAALAVGAMASCLLIAWWGATRRPPPVFGLVLGASFAFAIGYTIDRTGPFTSGPTRTPPGLVLGLALLGVVELVPYFRRRPSAAVALSIPAAIAIAAHGELAGPSWLRWVVGTTIVVGGWLAQETDRRSRVDGLLPVLFAITAVGMYYTLPDTEESLVLMGVLLPMAATAWLLRVRSLGAGGVRIAVAICAWTVAAGGVWRDTAIIGGIGSLGVIAGAPVAPYLNLRVRPIAMPSTWRLPAVSAIHLAAVYVASRVAGTATDGVVLPAVLAAGACVAGGVLASAALRGAPRASARTGR